jgi:hypothetical protein
VHSKTFLAPDSSNIFCKNSNLSGSDPDIYPSNLSGSDPDIYPNFQNTDKRKYFLILYPPITTISEA